MNIKSILLYFYILCFCLFGFQAAGQKKTGNWQATNWSHSSKNCHHLLSVPAQCHWSFFNIKGNMEGKIVSWSKIDKKDKILYAASVAIVKTAKETVRILLLSNYNNYKPGDNIKIATDKEPDVDTEVPLDRDFYMNEEKKGGKPVCRINSYDNKVLKTAWGRVVE